MTTDCRLPALPLVLCGVPPGLLAALGQEGVPTLVVPASRRRPSPSLRGGRFVLFDRRAIGPAAVREQLDAGQVAIDVDRYRVGCTVDPFEALVDTTSTPSAWQIGDLRVVERVNRRDKAAIRRRLIEQVRRDVVDGGGIWARLACFPFPFRSAFNLRIDLDEPAPGDYARFARARRPIDECTTHFVSTAAYGGLPEVIADLRRVDSQSHGHFHHVYRDVASNRRNLERAHAILLAAGFPTPEGFAGPHGRWNSGLDRVLEELGYRYSSDFQLGFDDRPSYPWLGDRFSRVLQVPVHPLCEGAFFEAGGSPATVGDHLVAVVRAAIAAHEPAFVYGHPEGRLGRYPAIVAAVADAVAGEDLVWKTTLTEFARWWRWRLDQKWSLSCVGDGRLAIDFEQDDRRYRPAVEMVREDHVATIPIVARTTRLERANLAYERQPDRVDRPGPTPLRSPRGLKASLRAALDWEKVTPVAEIAAGTLAGRLKRSLRRWQARG